MPILVFVNLQAQHSPYALVHDNNLERSCLLVLLFIICASALACLQPTAYPLEIALLNKVPSA